MESNLEEESYLNKEILPLELSIINNFDEKEHFEILDLEFSCHFN